MLLINVDAPIVQVLRKWSLRDQFFCCMASCIQAYFKDFQVNLHSNFHDLKMDLVVILSRKASNSFAYRHIYKNTAMILSFRTNRSRQTVQTWIRLLLEEQSYQGLHCLLFHLHLFYEIP